MLIYEVLGPAIRAMIVTTLMDFHRNLDGGAIMQKNVFLTGYAENVSEDDHPIYCNYTSYSSLYNWEIDLGGVSIGKEEFLENLFFSVEKNGGNSYFFPLPERKSTLCRFEWHHPWRKKAAQIRLGLICEIKKGKPPALATAYLGTNEGFRERGAINIPSVISTRKIREFQDWLAREIAAANQNRSQMSQTSWQFIFFAKGGSGSWKRPFYLLDGFMLILPVKQLKREMVFATIIRESGCTRGEAFRKASQTFHLALALLSLATGKAWDVTFVEGAPQYLEGAMSGNVEKLASQIYPATSTDYDAGATEVPTYTKAFVRRALRHFATDDEENSQQKEALFAFYGALLASKSRSLASVGFVAAIGSLASEHREKCQGAMSCSRCGDLHDSQHNLIGDRAAITKFLDATFSRAFGEQWATSKNFKDWMMSIYGEHRSQFVHDAKHRFEQFGQVFARSGAGVINIPTGIPTNKEIAQKRNRYEADIAILPSVVRIAVLENITSKMGAKFKFDKINLRMPDFSSRYLLEAFVGFPTSGWIRITP